MKKNNYKKNIYKEYLYKGQMGRLFNKCHEKMEEYYFENIKNILEVGCGFVPHINYVRHSFQNYYAVDLPIVKNLHKDIKKNFPNIIFNYYDGKTINFPNNFFDRIIISHVLEHVLEPEKFIFELMRVLKKGGIISIALPCDPGLAWRLGRFILKHTYLKNKIKNYDYIMATEHINSIFNLHVILKSKFNIIKNIFYPFNINFIDINLFYICQIKK